MIRKITAIHTKNTNPYHNLALEEYIFHKVEEDELILYLWQNRHTVVIGKNQNASVECKVNKLKEDGGYLTRRLSGGGAVYHDLGNLNFTFVMRKKDFDKSKQTDVILKAAQRLGIECEKTGRNDIVADGKKFSGHSYYSSGDRAFHNGTIMVSVDKNILSEYLNVSPLKLKSKGVESVRSRVVNLRDINPEITIEAVVSSLLLACQEEYGCTVGIVLDSEEYPVKIDDSALFEELIAKFKSEEWIYGREVPMEFSCERKFPWGMVRVDFDLQDGRISRSAIWSDSMDGDGISRVPDSIYRVIVEKDKLIREMTDIIPADVACDIADIITEEVKRRRI